MTDQDPISIRQPTTSYVATTNTSTSTRQTNYPPPTIDHLIGTWHVIYSSLPLWKSKRNVTITYKALEPTAAHHNQEAVSRLDDTVSYQTLTSDKIKTVHGIDTASGPGADIWDWRGTGWLKLASSHWEVIGYGQNSGEAWGVTYFASTLFTPAGIDIMSKSKKGISAETLSGIKAAFSNFDDENVKKLALKLFEVRID